MIAIAVPVYEIFIKQLNCYLPINCFFNDII